MTQVSSIRGSTRVTFPQGSTSRASKVVFVREYRPGSAIIVTEETPFHPVSHSWPDQQADFGTIEAEGVTLPVVDALTGAFDTLSEDFHFYVDQEVPVRKNEHGWVFVVAHIVALPDKHPLENLEGKDISLVVNGQRRRELSASHTASHLVALALNKYTRDFWRKEVVKDPLGNPNLDRLAIQDSVVMTSGSIDHYRFGKSLHKKGFDRSLFFEQLEEITSRINEQVDKWIETRQNVTIEVAGPTLESERWWICNLEGKDVKFPCGGTHLRSLGELESIDVSFELLPGVPEVKMHTAANLRNRDTLCVLPKLG